ncbi:hypothetical protein GCM10023310_13150 [Paenibacillus vulneris]
MSWSGQDFFYILISIIQGFSTTLSRFTGFILFLFQPDSTSCNSKHPDKVEVKVMFGKILLAYDGSETAKNALEQAMELKLMLPDSILEIVHVAQLQNVIVGDAFITSSAVIQDELHDAAEAVLDEARRRISHLGLATTTLLEGGTPAQMILDYVNDHLFDLIIVGSRGLGTFKELLLGSVSYEIVQHATIPVLVVK